MREETVGACELFNQAAEAFKARDLTQATVCLRQGFFENLYIAPLLLGEEFYPQEIWYPSLESTPDAARDYLRRYGDFWRQEPEVGGFLQQVWNDTLVRAELRSYINLSKNLVHAKAGSQREELLQERAMFVNPKRLERTQAEILQRFDRVSDVQPVSRPRLSLILLAARDPVASLEFYKNLLGLEPLTTNPVAGGYVEFEFEGVHLAIHGNDRLGDGDPYHLGPPPDSLGWGAMFVFQVAHVQPYYERALAAEIEIVDCDLQARGRRFFVVRDPSGYLLELTEESPQGLVSESTN